MDDWNLSKFISINDITSKLESARNYSDEVTFSSLEPTLHPKLDRIAKIAKTMNFKKIEVVTN
jgi:wyosine [tRNA(Phe)-imidazoG37] synthetase (radical SAM superfamily)